MSKTTRFFATALVALITIVPLVVQNAHAGNDPGNNPSNSGDPGNNPSTGDGGTPGPRPNSPSNGGGTPGPRPNSPGGSSNGSYAVAPKGNIKLDHSGYFGVLRNGHFAHCRLCEIQQFQ
jgi:hypothetical protein